MLRTAVALLLALPLAPGLAAQDPASGGGGQDPSAEYEALANEFRDARQTFFDNQKKAFEEGGEDALTEARKLDPVKDFVPRFQEGAAKYAPTPNALPYLQWLVTSSGDGGVAKTALGTILEHHADSADLEPIASFLVYGGRTIGKGATRDALRRLEQSPHANVRGAAIFAGAMITIQNQQATETAREGALDDVRRALETAPEAAFAGQAEGLLFERENLQVGKQVPDIEGNDLDGVAFKLSDYKGKVVVLDFWGHW